MKRLNPDRPLTPAERQARQRDRYRRMQAALQAIVVESKEPKIRRVAAAALDQARAESKLAYPLFPISNDEMDELQRRWDGRDAGKLATEALKSLAARENACVSLDSDGDEVELPPLKLVGIPLYRSPDGRLFPEMDGTVREGFVSEKT